MPTDGPIGEGFKLQFEGSEVSQNNLGGEGPDSGDENLRFPDIGRVSDASNDVNDQIDLVVTEISGYVPNNVLQNKVKGDSFGQINLLADRETTLEFCFEKPKNQGGEKVVIPSFGFVFHEATQNPLDKTTPSS